MDPRNGDLDLSGENLRDLYAQLGEALYERTKDDEETFLLAPSLYLAIADARREQASER